MPPQLILQASEDQRPPGDAELRGKQPAIMHRRETIACEEKDRMRALATDGRSQVEHPPAAIPAYLLKNHRDGRPAPV